MGGCILRAILLSIGRIRFIVALAVLLLSTHSSSAAPVTPNMPADFSLKQDSLGFGWQLMQNGILGNDNRGCFQQAFYLSVNNVNVHFQQQLMTADGSHYLFTGAVARQLEVTRHVKFDLKQ